MFFVQQQFRQFLEAPPRFELGIKVLQTHALPLGYGADSYFYYMQNFNIVLIEKKNPTRNIWRRGLCWSG